MNKTEDATRFDPPLLGVHVAEIVSGPMRLAARYFADLGAEVTRLEPRRSEPGTRDVPPVGAAIDRLVHDRGKAIVTFDADSDAERREQLERFESVDVLIEDISGTAGGAWLDVGALRRKHPSLVVLSISDFGQSGSFAGWQATEPVLQALSGGLARSGLPGREPLLPPDGIATRCAAAQAATVALMALYHRLRTGRGDRLDFSVLEGVMQTLDPGFGTAGSAAAGAQSASQTRGRPDVRFRYPIIACSDGFVRICLLSQRQWRAMFAWMGSPAEFASPEFDSIKVRFASAELLPAIGRFFAGKTCAEVERQGIAAGVPIAPVLATGAPNADEDDWERHRLEDASAAEGVREIRLPKGCLSVEGARAETKEGAAAGGPLGGVAPPGLLEHQPPDVLEDRAGSCRPLAGLRVLNLGVIVVGAESARLFADAGADVVKLENPAFPDGLRQTYDGGPMSGSFAAGYRNQRSLSLQLREPAGKAVFLELAKVSDVLLANFKPGTLEALSLGHETLLSVNPGLVIVESAAFDPAGPGGARMGYGPLVRAASGLTAAWSYADDPRSFSDGLTVYPDHVAARLGALTAVALLIRRRRTGRGGWSSLAQQDVIYDHLGAQLAIARLAREDAVQGDAARPSGMAIEEPRGPWGVYPCLGDDEWCVVTVRGHEDRRALVALLGLAPPAQAADAAIKDALTAWLALRTPDEAMHTLQNAGIPAGAMLRVADLPDFACLVERGFYRPLAHPALTERQPTETRLVRSANWADADVGPAPLMGEHSDEILREWIDASDARIGELVETGIVSRHSAPAAHRVLERDHADAK